MTAMVIYCSIGREPLLAFIGIVGALAAGWSVRNIKD